MKDKGGGELKKFLKYIRPYGWASLLGILLMLVELFADLFQPALIANIVDIGIENRDLAYILHTGLKMVGLAFIGMVGGLGSAAIIAYVSQSFGADLRVDLFKKIQTFSFSNLDQFKTASLITRLTNDVTQVQNMIRTGLRMMFRAGLLVIGGMIMAALLNQQLALIFLIAIPILIIGLIYIIKKGFPIFSEVQENVDQVNGVMRENLAGVRVIKAFVRRAYEENRFATVNYKLRDSTIKGSQILALQTPIMLLVLNFSIVAVLWFGGLQFSIGSIKTGEIVAFVNYLIRSMNALMRVAISLLMFSKAKISGERIIEVLETQADIEDKEEANDYQIKKGEVQFDRVSFAYHTNGAPVLKDISFKVRSGETVAILGGIGSGKSTLVQLIPRLYEATSGSIYIDGKEVREYTLESLRRQIGIVLQEARLFTGTIEDNLYWGKDGATEEDLLDATTTSQAHNFIKGFSKGYQTVLGQKGVNVSGGQKQRLSLARTLMKQPKLLIMDDSTSAVDLETEAKILEAINNRAWTTFIIAQKISSAIYADKVLVLERGEIVAKGTHQTLMRTSTIYQEIMASQGYKVGGNNEIRQEH